MQQTITEAIKNPSFFAFGAVFIVGMIAALGACVILEVPILIGYLGSVKTRSRRRLFAITLLFVLGLLVSYLVIGILIGLVATALGRLAAWSSVLYVVMGIFSLTLGLVLLGFIKLPTPSGGALSKLAKGKADLLGAFLIGMGFVFLEAPTCPACAPAIVLISAYMVTEQKIVYGLSLLMVYVAGQAVPILAIGLFTGWMKQFADRFHGVEEYLQIVGGILLILVGLDLLWLA